MIMRKAPIKNSTVASAMALYGILGGLFLNFNKLDLMTSGKKEDSHSLLALAVSFSLKVNVAIIRTRESFTLLLGIPVARLVRDGIITC